MIVMLFVVGNVSGVEGKKNGAPEHNPPIGDDLTTVAI